MCRHWKHRGQRLFRLHLFSLFAHFLFSRTVSDCPRYNAELLRASLELNPALASRIHLVQAAVSDDASRGGRVCMKPAHKVRGRARPSLE